ETAGPISHFSGVSNLPFTAAGLHSGVPPSAKSVTGRHRGRRGGTLASRRHPDGAAGLFARAGLSATPAPPGTAAELPPRPEGWHGAWSPAPPAARPVRSAGPRRPDACPPSFREVRLSQHGRVRPHDCAVSPLRPGATRVRSVRICPF